MSMLSVRSIGCRPMSDFSAATHKPASGFVCRTPTSYEFEGEIFKRSCGCCERCKARRKRDVSGRSAAEAYTAAEVVFFTLTYSDAHAGHVEFEPRDRQLFLKRLRSWLVDKTRRELGAPRFFPLMADHVRAYWKHRVSEVSPRIKFVGCGERGSHGSNRCHWHILIFASRKTGLVSTARYPSGRPVLETHALWDLGWVTVDVLPEDMGAKMRAVRYVTKYLTKSRFVTLKERAAGVLAEATFFRSTRPALGYEYLMAVARETARAGVLLNGEYRVPGVTNTCRGGAARYSVFMVEGTMRGYFIAAYRDEWERVRPEVPMRASDWQLMHDGEWVDVCLSQSDPETGGKKRWRLFPPRSGAEAFPAAVNSLPPYVPVEPGSCLVRGRDGAVLGLLVMDQTGFVLFDPVDGLSVAVGDRGMRDVPGMSEASARGVDAWIAARRGPDWVSPAARRLAERDLFAARQAAIERFAKDGANLWADKPWMPEERGVTALRRKLRLSGESYFPGAVVIDDPNGAPFVRGAPRLLRPVHKRKP